MHSNRGDSTNDRDVAETLHRIEEHLAAIRDGSRSEPRVSGHSNPAT